MKNENYFNKNYDITEEIITTNYSKISKALDKINKNIVVVKEIIKTDLLKFSEHKNKNIKKFRKEVKKLKYLKISNKINLIEFFETDTKFYIITEYFEYNLENLIITNKFSLGDIRILFNNLNKSFNRKIIFNEIDAKSILLQNQDINNANPMINYYSIHKIMNNKNDIKTFYRTIRNILSRINYNKLNNEEENLFNDLLKILLCEDEKKLLDINDYFNHKFWIFDINQKINENNSKALESLIKYNNKYKTKYNIYQEEISFLLKNWKDEEQINEFNKIFNHNFKTLKLIIETSSKDYILSKNIPITIFNKISENITSKLSHLDLSHNKIQSIDLLFESKSFTNIISLDLSENQITNINSLTSILLNNLTNLNLSHNKLTNISGLMNESLSNLQNLNLSCNLINSINLFKNVPFINSIKFLYLIQNKIIDIKIIQEIEFPNLLELDVSNNQLERFGINKNQNIEKIGLSDINYNSVLSNISINYNNLKEVDLSNNNLQNFNFISGNNIEVINLNDNEINDITNLSKFNNLKKLLFVNNNISDISILINGSFNKLNEINFSGNKIIDISILSECNFKNLTELNLSFNKIRNIDVLSDVCFEEIEIISFRGNKIEDINVFSKVKFFLLEEIDLSENQIQDIGSLNNENVFSEMSYLDLRDNDIDVDLEKNKEIIEKYKNVLLI